MTSLKNFKFSSFTKTLFYLTIIFGFLQFNACNSCQRGGKEDDDFDKKDVSAYSGTITRKSSTGEDPEICAPQNTVCGTDVSVVPIESSPTASVTSLSVTVCNQDQSNSVSLCVSASIPGDEPTPITYTGYAAPYTIPSKGTHTFTINFSSNFTPSGTGTIVLGQGAKCSSTCTDCDYTDTLSVTFCSP